MLAQKQPLIQRVRNSSLVECLCAEDITGLNIKPKLGIAHCAVVEERCVVGRRDTVRSPGRGTSENAGMSSENYVRIIMVENLRFLEEGSSAQGKPGAKARRKRVVDAHTVEIQ